MACCRCMAMSTSTITSKWQITIPEGVRKELPLKVGQRIAWEIEGDRLVGRRVQSISELAGCLKAGGPPSGGRDDSGAFAQAAVDRDKRVTPPKP